VNMRKNLEEMLATYELEPTLCDVFCEGGRDERLLRKALSAAGYQSVAVKSVDVLDIPAELVLASNESVGNKGRVVALARLLCEAARQRSVTSPAVCVADRDIKHRDRSSSIEECLIFTAGTSIENCFMGPVLISSLLTAGNAAAYPAELVKDFNAYLNHCYAIRVVADELSLPLYITPAKDVWNLSGQVSRLDVSKMMDKATVNCPAKVEEFRRSFQNAFNKCKGNWSYGFAEDIYTAMSHVLRKILNMTTNEQALEHMYWLACESRHLPSEQDPICTLLLWLSRLDLGTANG
jgi:hypothetical protein